MDFPISELPENRNTENPDFRIFRKIGNPISANPDFRESENPDFQISGLPNLRKSGFPEIRKFRFSDFRGIGCRIFRGIRCRASDGSGASLPSGPVRGMCEVMLSRLGTCANCSVVCDDVGPQPFSVYLNPTAIFCTLESLPEFQIPPKYPKMDRCWICSP